MRSRSRSTTIRVATLWTRPAESPWRDLAPENRRHLVAVEPVEDAPCLLRVDEAAVEIAGMVDGLLDRGRGDLVEHHPPHRHPGREHLGEVPGDRLAFAVLVGREVDLARVADEAAELGDLLALLPRDDVKRLEIVVDVDPEARPRLGLERRRDLGGGSLAGRGCGRSTTRRRSRRRG